MNKRRMYTIGLMVLLLGVTLTTYSVWLTGSFSYGDPSFDEGCYCHNNGIAVLVNGSGDGNGGVYLGSVTAGTSFHILLTTNNTHATGVVPGVQLWESNQTDNAKFTFTPTEVTATSPQNLSPIPGNITALYKVTVPASLASGFYSLTPYAQGTLLEPILIEVTGVTTSTTTTTSTASTSTTQSSTSTTSSTSSTSTTSTISTTRSTTSTTTAPNTTTTTSTPTTTTSTPTTVSITSPSSGASLVGNQTYTISGKISPTPSSPDSVLITVQLQDSFVALDSAIQAVTSSGTFSYTTNVGGNSSWVSGTYVITVTDSYGATGTTTFEYTALTTTMTTTMPTTTTVTRTMTSTTSLPVTSTVIQSVTGPTTTVTGPTSTITSTATTTAPPSTVTSTSTFTQTTSTTAGWAYGAMAVLLVAGLVIGYVVKRPPTKQG